VAENENNVVDEKKVKDYIMMNKKYFPENKLYLLEERLKKMTEDELKRLHYLELKEPTTMLIISILVGEFGIDRFMLGDVGMGILKLLTFGLCGILWIYDIVTIQRQTKEKNLRDLQLGI